MGQQTLDELACQVLHNIVKQLEKHIGYPHQIQKVRKSVLQPQFASLLDRITIEKENNSGWISNLNEENQYLRSAIEMMKETVYELKQFIQKQNQNKMSTQQITRNIKLIQEDFDKLSEEESSDSYSQFRDQIEQIQSELSSVVRQLGLLQSRQANYQQQIEKLKMDIDNYKLYITNLPEYKPKSYEQVIEWIHSLREQNKNLKNYINTTVETMKKSYLTDITLLYQHKIVRQFEMKRPGQIKRHHENLRQLKNKNKPSIAQLNKRYQILSQHNLRFKDRVNRIMIN